MTIQLARRVSRNVIDTPTGELYVDIPDNLDIPNNDLWIFGGKYLIHDPKPTHSELFDGKKSADEISKEMHTSYAKIIGVMDEPENRGYAFVRNVKLPQGNQEEQKALHDYVIASQVLFKLENIFQPIFGSQKTKP